MSAPISVLDIVFHSLSKTSAPGMGDFAHFENELAISACRIILEALSNVMKHANAAFAPVAQILSESDRMLHIEVADDGAGFDTAGFDTALHGTIELRSTPGTGTVIAIALPVRTATDVS
jgi:two-component system sensor histidine kinase UhpB